MSFLQLFNKKKDTTTETNNTNCSVFIGVDSSNEYSFEINWNHNFTKAPDQLANLIIGLSYGLFSEEVISILKDNQDVNEIDSKIINETLDLLEKKNNVLKEVAMDKIAEPLVKPSHVFKP